MQGAQQINYRYAANLPSREAKSIFCFPIVIGDARAAVKTFENQLLAHTEEIQDTKSTKSALSSMPSRLKVFYLVSENVAFPERNTGISIGMTRNLLQVILPLIFLNGKTWKHVNLSS